MVKLAQIGRGIGWSTISVVVIAASQLGFMAIMARLLTPADFGLVAVAGISLRFATYFAQLGVGPAIIQKSTLLDEDIAAGNAVSLGLGLVFTCVAIFAAPAAEWFFEMPKLANVTRALALSFLIASLGTVAAALLRRRMRFKPVAIIEIIAYIGGYGVIGLTCAYAGFGVWALVIAAISQGLISAFGSVLVVGRECLQLRHGRAARSHFLAFGTKYSLIGFVEFLSFNLDSIIVGKLVGLAPIGQYNRAMLLANLPVQQPVGILTRVLHPGLSQWQGDADKFRSGVQGAMLVVGLYAFVVSGFISTMASDIVAVLLGSGWQLAAEVLVVLALGAGPFCISNVAGVTMDAQAALRPKLLLQSSMLALLLVSMLLLVPRFGVIGAAWAMVLIEWLRMGAYLFLFYRQTLLDKPTLCMVAGVPCAILFTVLLIVPLVMGSFGGQAHLLRLMVGGSVSALCALLILLFCRRRLADLSASRALIKRFPGVQRVL